MHYDISENWHLDICMILMGRYSFRCKNKVGKQFEDLKRLVDVGDFIGVEGEIITTKTGEKL